MTLQNVLCIAALCSAPLLAQEIRTNIMYAPAPDGSPPPVGLKNQMFSIVGREFSFGPEALVKDAPFSADDVTESTQILGDGNRIVSRQQGALYRDSQGRTRTEHTLPTPEAASAQAPKMVNIVDPVAGVSYSLEPTRQVAHKFSMNAPSGELNNVRMSIRKLTAETAARNGTLEARSMEFVFTNGAVSKDNVEVNKESLGEKNVEGVVAQGTRSTQTIPANALGNERPIVVTTENWFSPELKMTVLTKHSDPRFGETVHKLTNIRTGEPDATLFSVPAGYTVQDAAVKEVHE
jgi:hypothetical protein